MLLKLAGVLSALVALLHVAIVLVGPRAYRYFGAGERMAQLAEKGFPGPALLTLALTMVFAMWSAYAFSGAGLLRRLPLLRPALVAIGSIYTVRGLILGPQLIWFFTGDRDAVPLRHIVFSAVSLVTGLAYLIGAKAVWAQLGGKNRG